MPDNVQVRNGAQYYVVQLNRAGDRQHIRTGVVQNYSLFVYADIISIAVLRSDDFVSAERYYMKRIM